MLMGLLLILMEMARARGSVLGVREKDCIRYPTQQTFCKAIKAH